MITSDAYDKGIIIRYR